MRPPHALLQISVHLFRAPTADLHLGNTILEEGERLLTWQRSELPAGGGWSFAQGV